MDAAKKMIAIVAVIIVVAAGAAAVVLTRDDGDKSYRSADDTGRLTIFGNANNDDYLDDDDVSYLEDIIAGNKTETKFADANQDGKIDQSDVDMVKKMVKRESMKVNYLNVDNKVKSCSYPVNGKLVVLYNKTLEAIRTLGASDQVIGTDDFTLTWSTYFPEFMSVTNVGNRGTPDEEKILEIGTKAVITGTTQWYGKTLEQNVEPQGVDIIRLATWEQGQVVSGLITLGFLLGHEDEGYAYAEWADKLVSKVTERLASENPAKPSVIVLDANNVYSTKKSGSGQYENSVTAGGNNIVASISSDSSYYKTLDYEWIAAKDPEFIVFSQSNTAYDWDDAKLKEKMGELKETFGDLSAAKNDKMHILNLEIFIGPSYPISILYMASWFYPDLFSDLDPAGELQWYITNCCGLDMDVAAHGGFAL